MHVGWRQAVNRIFVVHVEENVAIAARREQALGDAGDRLTVRVDRDRDVIGIAGERHVDQEPVGGGTFEQSNEHRPHRLVEASVRREELLGVVGWARSAGVPPVHHQPDAVISGALQVRKVRVDVAGAAIRVRAAEAVEIGHEQQELRLAVDGEAASRDAECLGARAGLEEQQREHERRGLHCAT